MNIAILLAAGKSQRAGQNKLWADVDGKPLWTQAYQTLVNHSSIHRVIVVVPKGDEFRFLPFLNSEKAQITAGGATRMESLKRGLAASGFTDSDILIDHNAANPYVTPEEISEVLAAAKIHGAAGVSHPAVDTLLLAEGDHYTRIIPRENVRCMQTPQAVRGDILKSLTLEEATDLASALLAKNIPIKVVTASPANKKITTAEDLEGLHVQANAYYLGEDSHRFSDSGQLTLGGLTIPDCPAMEANSDGDVILHAIGRALAQAKNASFSDAADALCEAGERNSTTYLESLLTGLQISQVSVSLECDRPRIDPLTEDLKLSLSEILQIRPEQVGISAHTGEDLSPFGRGEGVRCTTILTIQRKGLK